MAPETCASYTPAEPTASSKIITHGKYTIEASPAPPLPFERRPGLFIVSHVVAWGIWLLYIAFQLHLAWKIQASQQQWLWRIWAALFAEIGLAARELVVALSAVSVMLSQVQNPTRPRLKLVGTSAPSIDVLIPCCNERIDVIVDTLEGVVKQDYPSDRLRVFILDDGQSKSLAESVKCIGKRSANENGPKVYYLSREVRKGQKSYFKAGNLQFGFEESARLSGAEYLASIDADMIPERDWLRRVAPHLLLDDGLGLACPPQRYYNVRDVDPFGQVTDFDVFYTLQEPINDRVNGAMCSGTAFLVRRKALDDIGGWPLIEIGDDIMCSTVLSNAGWKVAFIREYVQLGLAPDTLWSHLKQRMRWVESDISVHKRFGFYIWPTDIPLKMTISQRAIGLLQTFREYCPIINLWSMLILPIALFPVRNDEFQGALSGQSRLPLIGVFLAAWIAKRIHNHIVFGHIGPRRLAIWQSNDVWYTPYLAAHCLLTLLPSGLHEITHEVSGAIGYATYERSATKRKPLAQRICNLHVLMWASYAVLAATPLILRLHAYLGCLRWADACAPLFPFPGIFLKLFDHFWKVLVPVLYMISPPTMPERARLLETDERGVRQPRRMFLQQREPESPLAWFWADMVEICLIFCCL